MDLSIYKIKKIRDIIFFFIVYCLIFDYTSKTLWFTFLGLGGPYARMLGVYPIILGIFLTVYMTWKGYIQICNQYVISFFGISFIISGISIVHGLFIYPYWDIILNAPTPQLNKVPQIFNFFHNYNMNISYREFLATVISLWSLKVALLDLLYRFGFAYMLFLWYKNDLEAAWNILVKGMLAGVITFVLYGFIDVSFLYGSSNATSILKMINPIIHNIGEVHDWWPPLLWEGQFRSIFSEPSRVGNYIAFVLPFLFAPVINRERYWKYYCILIFIVAYMVFLTNARTAVAMLLGIIVLTTFLLIVLRWKYALKQFSIIIFITCIAFGISVAFSPSAENNNINMNEAAVSYMENNLGSLASADKRSNQARYALIKANFKNGMEHPWLGVGTLLNGAYVVDHFDEFDLQSEEVKQWVKAYQEMGPLRHNFDAMNEYVTTFSTSGLLGLFCLLLPFLYGGIYLFRCIYNLPESINKGKLVSLWVSMVSSLVAGCNGSLNLIYSAWILLAIMYIVIAYDNEAKDEKSF